MADNNNKMDILDFGDGDVADSIIKVIGVEFYVDVRVFVPTSL